MNKAKNTNNTSTEGPKDIPPEVADRILSLVKRGVNGERITIVISTNGEHVFLGSTTLWRQ